MTVSPGASRPAELRDRALGRLAGRQHDPDRARRCERRDEPGKVAPPPSRPRRPAPRPAPDRGRTRRSHARPASAAARCWRPSGRDRRCRAACGTSRGGAPRAGAVRGSRTRMGRWCQRAGTRPDAAIHGGRDLPLKAPHFIADFRTEIERAVARGEPDEQLIGTVEVSASLGAAPERKCARLPGSVSADGDRYFRRCDGGSRHCIVITIPDRVRS